MAQPTCAPTADPAPTPAVASAPLRNIVVGHALGAGGDSALALGRQLARACGAALHLVHATPGGLGAPHGEPPPALSLRELAREVGAEAHVRAGDPAHVIRALALELDADRIVLASRRAGGAARSLIESVAIRTLRHAPCAVLVIPLRAESLDLRS